MTNLIPALEAFQDLDPDDRTTFIKTHRIRDPVLAASNLVDEKPPARRDLSNLHMATLHGHLRFRDDLLFLPVVD